MSWAIDRTRLPDHSGPVPLKLSASGYTLRIVT
jgi:hypothetical protein